MSSTIQSKNSGWYAPIPSLVLDTIQKSALPQLESVYFKEFGGVTKWQCFSDYSFDSTKQNDVITFTFNPYIADFTAIGSLINHLAPKDIKKTKTPNPAFLHFIRNSPFLTFSFILENHTNMFFHDREKMKANLIINLDQMLNTDIPNWSKSRPHLAPYHQQIARKIRTLRADIKRDKKIRITKNMLLITSIGSVLCTQLANRTTAEMMGWFSDRDEINDVADKLSLDLFNIQFSETLINTDCKFVVAPASSRDDEFYEEFVRVPDYITGALADYKVDTDEITHDKFAPVIRDLIADNTRNVFVFRLVFDQLVGLSCSRILFSKKPETS